MAVSPTDELIPHHGGNLALAESLYGHPREGWLDLSTGINPNLWSASPDAFESVNHLPATDALQRLLAIARHAYGVADALPIAAVPGSEIAIRLLPLVAPPGSVAVVAPTYGSHGEAWRNDGRRVTEVATLDDVPAEATIAVLVNPNNPDGRLVEPDVLVALTYRLGERGGLLVVDEAFGDVAPEASLAPHLAGLPAVILRSLGKFYGLPGLRLGFVAGTRAVVEPLARLLGDWPVSGPALAIGQAALADAAWQAAVRLRLAGDRNRLQTLLDGHSLGIVGGTDLFVLASHPEARTIHRGLAQRGVWTRAFAGHPTWLRLGVPGNDSDFDRLDRALAAVMAAR